MSAKVKEKKELEKKAKQMSINSMRIGILSGGALFLSLILDILSIIFNIKWVSILLGCLMLVLIFVVMTKWFGKLLDKVPRKDYLRNVIDTATISSVFAFVIERSFMPLLEDNREEIWVVVFLIACFLVLPIATAIALFTKKDAKYNVD